MNKKIEVGQWWKVNFTSRDPIFIKCVEEQEDKYLFEDDDQHIITVDKDKLSFFLERTELVVEDGFSAAEENV